MTHILIPRSDNTSAKIIEASDWEKYGNQVVQDYVVCGFTVTATCGVNRSVDISTGALRLNGTFVQNSTCETAGYTFSTDDIHYLYVTLCRDPSCEPQGWVYSSNTTGTTPTDSLMIAKVETVGGDVSTINQGVNFKKVHHWHAFVGTGAEINALSNTYPGQTVISTKDGSGFSTDVIYVRNICNTSWNPLTHDQLPYLNPSTNIACYCTPAAYCISSSGPGSLKAQVLVVGGGGGGGNKCNSGNSYYGGGGGGGGGVLDCTSALLCVGCFTITVGGATGTSSIGCSYIAYGGVRGGNAWFQCGGGGGGNSGTPTSTSPSSPNSGAPFMSQGRQGGGGGGAGGSTSSVHGGTGRVSQVTGNTYGGGGGGGGGGYNTISGAGNGGSGGGGNGANNSSAQSGTANTGGGGGGASVGAASPGGGGSGVVVIKYLTADGVATGGTITTCGSYKLHTFNSSGTFSLTCTVTGGNIVDDDICTYWVSACEANPRVRLDLSSNREIVGMALNINTCVTTINEFKVRSNTTTSFTDANNIAYISISDFTCGTWRYIPFNFDTTNKRYVQLYGVGTGIFAINEVKFRYGVSDTIKILSHMHGTRVTSTPSSFVDTN